MDVHFTPEQEEQLSQLASHKGKNAEQLVEDAALRLLKNHLRFREGVTRGIEAANRGDFVEEEEMDAHIEQMLQSC